MNYLKIETFPEQNKIQFGRYINSFNPRIIKSIIDLFHSKIISFNFYDNLPKDIAYNKYQKNYTNKEKNNY